MSNATTQAVLIQAAFFGLSLVGAWIVLVLLKGTAKIRHKGAQFGGAAAMFLAMFVLLNKYVPEMRDGIIAEASAAQGQRVVTRNDTGRTETLEVYLNPARQKISIRDLRELDRNKYFIDEQFGVAILRSDTSDWSVGAISSFDQIGMADLPMNGMIISMAPSLAPQLIANQIVGAKTGEIHTIVIERDSEIGGIPVTKNPWSDEQAMRTLMESNMKMMAEMGLMPEIEDELKMKEVIDLAVKETNEKFGSAMEKYIAKTFPMEKKIQSGVYVTVFDVDRVRPNLFSEVLTTMSSLDRAVTALAMKGFAIGGGKNLKIDQQRRIASFDGSTRLRGVLVNGSKTDVTLNDIGFIVVGDHRIVFVQLVSLDIDGLSTSLLLKRIMDSLLFVN